MNKLTEELAKLITNCIIAEEIYGQEQWDELEIAFSLHNYDEIQDYIDKNPNNKEN